MIVQMQEMAVVCSGKEKHGKHSMRKVFGVLKMAVDSEHCIGCWEKSCIQIGKCCWKQDGQLCKAIK